MPRCPCVKRHSPKLVVTDKHHILPQSWGGQTTPENLVEVCPSTHFTIHACLDEYVRAKGTPAPSALTKYPAYARSLAQQAIDRHGGIVPHIYTLNHSWQPGDPHAH